MLTDLLNTTGVGADEQRLAKAARRMFPLLSREVKSTGLPLRAVLSLSATVGSQRHTYSVRSARSMLHQTLDAVCLQPMLTAEGCPCHTSCSMRAVTLPHVAVKFAHCARWVSQVEPHEMAAIVYFLCSDAALNINGVNIPVDQVPPPCSALARLRVTSIIQCRTLPSLPATCVPLLAAPN